MILYTYDSYGILVGPLSPSLSPSRPFLNGKPNYLRPANATEQLPPQTGQGQVAVFSGHAWTLMEDHRGVTVYDTRSGFPGTMNTLGPIPDTHTAQAPPSPCHVWRGGGWVEDGERLLEAMRRERNARLSASDWTQLADAPRSPQCKASWALYRQALRDHPIGWVKGKAWPEPPQE